VVPPASQPLTLGDLLHAGNGQAVVCEDTWVDLVRSIAAGDQLALHALYTRTYGVVFTWITRIIGDWDAAEALTRDVFHDVWRTAATYDPASGSVVGWVMDTARSRAIGRRQFEGPPLSATIDVVSSPADIPQPPASRWELLARRIAAAETGEAPVAWAPEGPAEPEWQEVARGISCKLLSTDTEHDRVSMLVWLAAGVPYPPHRHAGVEELYLLHGELMIDDWKLYPGDYNRAAPGTADQRVWSGTGCMCVLLTSPRDLLASVPPTPAQALRALIRDKLRDGRLPYSIPRFWGGPGEGQTCDACEGFIADQMLVQGIAWVGWDRRPLQMHLDCFALWDQERQPLS
jgi:DNA-directed RNA polymerase specialized sigma24 family protein